MHYADKYSWEWLEARIGKDLISCAKYFVQHPGSGVYWNRTWPISESEALKESFVGLCRNFDPEMCGCKTEEAPHFFLFMFFDSLMPRARKILKAMALVAKKDCSNLEEARQIFRDQEKHLDAIGRSVSEKSVSEEADIEARAWQMLEDSGLIKKVNGKPEIVASSTLEFVYLFAKFEISIRIDMQNPQKENPPKIVLFNWNKVIKRQQIIFWTACWSCAIAIDILGPKILGWRISFPYDCLIMFSVIIGSFWFGGFNKIWKETRR